VIREVRETGRGLVHLRMGFHPRAGLMEWAVEQWRGCLFVRCADM